MKLSEWTDKMLEAELRYQAHIGICTVSACKECGAGARGGGYCADCICAELERRNDTSVNWPEAKPIEEHE